MEENLAEHCPGPPAADDELAGKTMDDDLRTHLRHKEEELQQLRNEVQSYAGKLKGYQTIGMTLGVI